MSGNGQSLSVLAILREGIDALAHADTPRLERLREWEGAGGWPEEERRAVREHYRALGLLLGLTRRNLRLLRGEHGGMY